MPPRPRFLSRFLVSHSFSTRESVAESPSRNTLGTLRTQPGLPGGHAGRRWPPPGRVPGQRVPACGLLSTWGHLGPALLPSQVLGNGAGPPGSSVRGDAAEARPSYRGRRDLPLLDLRRWEERVVSGCRWGQVWAREHFAAWACATSASYSGLVFPNFGPTWSGRQVRLGNFLLWVAANNPPGSLLELVADKFRSDTYLPVICLSHKLRYTSPGPVCIFPLSQWRRRRTRPRCLAAQCGWGPLGLFTPPSSSRVRGPGSPAAEQLLWPRRASMLSSVKKIQLLRFLTRIPPLDLIPRRRSPAFPGTARLAASGSVAALQSCLVGRLKISRWGRTGAAGETPRHGAGGTRRGVGLEIRVGWGGAREAGAACPEPAAGPVLPGDFGAEGRSVQGQPRICPEP